MPAPALLGRTVTLARLDEAVREGAPRVGLSGPPGVGKSVVLRAWAAGRGLPVVEGGGARTFEDLATIVLDGLGLPGARIEPALAAAGPCILVIDGLDRLGDAEDLLDRWLEGAPELQVVFARRGRGRGHAPEIAVEPLDLASALSLLGGDSLTHAELAEALDRIPLALEVARGALRLLPVQDVLQRARSPLRRLPSAARPELRASIDSVWELLDPAGQRALSWLSVFEGRFTASAAESLFALLGRDDALDALDAFATGSLVRVDPVAGSMRLSAPLRERGRQAWGPDSAAMQRAHAQVVAADLDAVDWRLDGVAALDALGATDRVLARELGQRFICFGPVRTGERLLAAAWSQGQDHDDSPLRHTLAACRLRLHDPTGALAVLDAAPTLWDPPACVLRIEAALRSGDVAAATAAWTRAREPMAPAIRAELLSAEGLLHLEAGRVQEARGCLEGAWQALLRLGATREAAIARLRLGRVASEEQEWPLALALADAAREGLGDEPWWRALADWQRAWAFTQLGRDAEARQACDAAERAWEAWGDNPGVGRARGLRGVLALLAGELDEARGWFIEARRTREEPGRPQGTIALLRAWSLLDHRQGRGEQARLRLDEAEALARGAGDPRLLAEVQASRALLEGRLPTSAAGLLRAPTALQLRLVAAGVANAPEVGSGPAELLGSRTRVDDDRPRGADDGPRGADDGPRGADPDRRAPLLQIGSDGRWFAREGEPPVDLSRRRALRLLLAALAAAHPGHGLDVHSMAEAGWPGERLHPEPARARVYTAIRTLRRMGLEGLLLTHDDGYLLARDLVLDRTATL